MINNEIKEAIEFLKSEKPKHTKPFHKFYDTALSALEKENQLNQVMSSRISSRTSKNYGFTRLGE